MTFWARVNILDQYDLIKMQMFGLSLNSKKNTLFREEKPVLKRTSKQVNKNQMIRVFHDILKTNLLQQECEHSQKNKQIADKPKGEED